MALDLQWVIKVHKTSRKAVKTKHRTLWVVGNINQSIYISSRLITRIAVAGFNEQKNDRMEILLKEEHVRECHHNGGGL